MKIMEKLMTVSVFEQLKKQISAIEKGSSVKKNNIFLSTGSPEVDRIFRSISIQSGSLFEILPKNYRQQSAAMGAALAFGARLLHEKPGALIWCQPHDRERLHLHAPGLMAFGINPDRVIRLTVKNERDLLWAMEEALDCSCLCGVIGVLWQERLYNFTASRRLLLRAKKSDVSALMLRSHRANGNTAADIRFEISGKPSSEMPIRETFLPRIGKPIWNFNLKKCRGTDNGSWQIGWNHETISFDLASRLAGRASLSESTEQNRQYAG